MRDPYSDQPAEWLFDAGDNRGIAGSFSYHRGSDGHVFLHPVPSTLARHYEGGYQPLPRSEAELAAAAADDAYRLDLIRTLRPSGTFLEIGPWIGQVAYSALKAGYRVSTLEMNKACVDLMNSVGIEAVQTDDPAVTLRDMNRRFDVVGLWHSIEHIPKPWELIAAAAEAVAPGGVLVVAAPNPLAAQFRVYGKDWLHLDAPRHLHLMPAETYEAIAAARGLRTVECTTDDRLGRILDRDGWAFAAHRAVGNLPVLRTIARHVMVSRLARRHRTPGALDGAGFTLTMARPQDEDAR